MPSTSPRGFRALAACVLLSHGLGCAGTGEETRDGGVDGEGEGEPEGPTIIGDPDATAELEIVYRTVEGELALLTDGTALPLIQPMQGGKVSYVAVRGKNVTSRVQLTVGVFEECSEPPVAVALESRPSQLVDDGTGTAVPTNNPADVVVGNMSNVPMCPRFSAGRDIDDNPYLLQVRVLEQRRVGEDEPRVHELEAHVVPFCAEALNQEDCLCECDAGFSLLVPKEEQCPGIHIDDPPDGQCPASEQ
jgi:hypothetical protein